jgi:hypothetical protein
MGQPCEFQVPGDAAAVQLFGTPDPAPPIAAVGTAGLPRTESGTPVAVAVAQAGVVVGVEMAPRRVAERSAGLRGTASEPRLGVEVSVVATAVPADPAPPSGYIAAADRGGAAP